MTQTIAELLALQQLLIDVCEPGPVRDQLQGRLTRVRQRIAEFPDRVADQAAMKSREDVEAILAAETAYIIAAFDQVN
jgi:hypothetical protein